MPNFTQADINNLMSILQRGKQNAIHAVDLAIGLGYNPSPNQEDTRALIRYAIENGELIGSNNNGYWILDSVAEVDEVLDSLEGRAQGVCDRRNNIKDHWNATHPHNNTSLPDKNVL